MPKNHFVLTVLEAEGPDGGDGVADEEDGVEDAERDQQLVEGALHLRAPQHDDGEDVPDETEPAHDTRDEAREVPLPILQDL